VAAGRIRDAAERAGEIGSQLTLGTHVEAAARVDETQAALRGVADQRRDPRVQKTRHQLRGSQLCG
jgi:hypothetical protein